mgnify:FL=1|jgi:hypothetical protein|tara:strand:- start:460 stop:681 length:222 start_codon:yes stop_codon:yes gene_type:complete
MSEEREVLAARLAEFIFGYIIDGDYLRRLDDICATIADNVTKKGIDELYAMIEIIEDEQMISLGERRAAGELD